MGEQELRDLQEKKRDSKQKELLHLILNNNRPAGENDPPRNEMHIS